MVTPRAHRPTWQQCPWKDGWAGAKAQLQTRAGHIEVRSGPTRAWGTTGPVSLPVCLGWLRVLAVWAICKRVIYRWLQVVKSSVINQKSKTSDLPKDNQERWESPKVIILPSLWLCDSGNLIKRTSKTVPLDLKWPLSAWPAALPWMAELNRHSSTFSFLFSLPSSLPCVCWSLLILFSCRWKVK